MEALTSSIVWEGQGNLLSQRSSQHAACVWGGEVGELQTTLVLWEQICPRCYHTIRQTRHMKLQ